MNEEILPNSCRICLKQNTKLTSLYSEDEYEEKPSEMLMKLTGVQLEEENELPEVPKQICRNCICELNLAYQFRAKALKTQQIIDLYRDELVNCLTLVENEIVDAYIEVNETNDDHDSDSIDYNEETIELLGEIKGDCIEHFTIIKETNTQTKSKFSKKKRIAIKKSSTFDTNELNCKAQSDGRALKTCGRKAKSTRSEKTFFCDICGNTFSKRSRLTEHRYRHGTELRYTCELCGERFLLREMLRRHLFSHSGEKPHKCSYCSRTFFYESVKKAHEAVHEGHKPYVCSQCKRAFAYPHSLKKHELIHANVKQYRCEICDKNFRLLHHLKQHEQTTKHLQKVKKK